MTSDQRMAERKGCFGFYLPPTRSKGGNSDFLFFWQHLQLRMV